MLSNSFVYLDHAATTPLDERALEAMLPYLGGDMTLRGNPSSLHTFGASAREALEGARASVAQLIGTEPEEVLFTSGGTESDNLGVLGLAAASPEKRHVVVSAIEHPAVRNAAIYLQAKGYELTKVGVDPDGIVDPAGFARALRPETALAAVMWANNEVGAVQPIDELAEICHERDIAFHVDAVQAAGRLPVDVSRVPISTLALSSHKIYGPQGVGALYIRRGVRLEPTVFGGGQERGLRSGTENVAGIVGFGAAASFATGELLERSRHDTALRDVLISGATTIPGVRLNGHPTKRLSNNVHLSVEGVEAESLVLYLDALGFAVGSGSACASATAGHKASPVLLAMGQEDRDAFSAVRVTVGKDTKRTDVDGFLEALNAAVTRLRELSPLYTN